jgi:hypothetical protein
MTTPIITWQVQQMSCYPESGGETDVVFQVNWVCIAAVSAEPNATSVVNPGLTFVPMPSGTFTPYDQLTQDQVLDWVWGTEYFDKAGVEAATAAQLEQIVNPPVVTPPLPWVTQESASPIVQPEAPTA